MRSAPVLWLLILAAPVSAQNPGDFLSRYPADPYSCTAAAEGTRYANTATHTMRYCDGSAWADVLGSGGGGGGITGSGSANTIPKFTGASTIGNSTVIDDGTVVTVNTSATFRASGSVTPFWQFSGTLPNIEFPFGLRIPLSTTSGTTPIDMRGVTVELSANSTGTAAVAIAGRNDVATTGNTQAFPATGGTVGVHGHATGGTNLSVGVFGYAEGDGTSIGVVGRASTSTTQVAVAGIGGQIGGHFQLSATNPTFTGAALVADNNAFTSPIFIARDNGNEVFEVGDGGDLRLDVTITAGGTTGNRTINKAAGTVNFAAAASTLTVTNSLVSGNSLVFAIARTNDTTCMVKDVEAASGSFVIRMTAACTAETSVAFWVINDA